MATAILIGAAGFVGSHFRRKLGELGYESILIDPVGGDRILSARFQDIARDLPTCDLIVNAGGNVGGRSGIEYRPMWVAENLALDQAFFDYCVHAKARGVYFSSPAAYPTVLQGLHSRLVEDDFCGNIFGVDEVYGMTKAVGERLAVEARRLGATVHVFRPFSGYGEGQSTDYPFAAFAARARQRDDPFVIWGSGTQTRDWVHIDDVIATVFVAIGAECPLALNIGTGVATTMVELASIFASAARYSPKFAFQDGPEGCGYRVADTTRSHAYYVPQISVQEGVERALR